MQQKDFNQILNATSFFIYGGNKAGKMTVALYFISFLFKKNALVLTPQESHLFKRRIKALKTLYPQFEQIDQHLNTYYLKVNEYKTLKQRYGFDFFLQEIEKIITSAKEELVLIHRFGEFFEFQDRFEIERVFKKIIQIAEENNKKILILVSSMNENFQTIHTIADEYSDISLEIEATQESKRLIKIQDLLHNKAYPLLEFVVQDNSFLLDYYHKAEDLKEERIKNILVCELNEMHEHFYDVLSYIFDKPGFRIKKATSLQTILQQIFVNPDVIIVLMKRTEENFQTVQALKNHLPSSPILVILDQEFVRSEDAHKAFSYGVDELFSNDLNLDNLILACQKATKSLFYTQEIEQLPKYPNILSSLEEMKTLAKEALKRSIFFTIFVFEVEESEAIKPTRAYDFIYKQNNKIYFFALNTTPKKVQHIVDKYQNAKLLCLWEPINHSKIESCFQ